jgi:putative NIF3 family GTP cyclohydrolase 1 type 2
MLKGEGLRYSKGKGKKISKVAVCGGSGSQLLSRAISEGADAFVTADIKYHTFQEAENKILLIDAGHYETEIHSLAAVKEKIENLFRTEKVKGKVHLYQDSTNPVKFYKQKES